MCDLSEIKTIIKSVLASSQSQLTLRELQRDFQLFAGYNVPYSNFGFRNCEDFLRSINDTCVVNGVGNFARVIPILSSSSGHIVQMIAKQKTSNKKGVHRPKNNAIIIPDTRTKPIATQRNNNIFPSPAPNQSKSSKLPSLITLKIDQPPNFHLVSKHYQKVKPGNQNNHNLQSPTFQAPKTKPHFTKINKTHATQNSQSLHNSINNKNTSSVLNGNGRTFKSDVINKQQDATYKNIDYDQPHRHPANNVMVPGDIIDVEILPSNKEQLYTQLYIVEVYDLSKFWFVLAAKEEDVIENYKNIQSFYDINYNNYKVTFNQLHKGLYVILYKGLKDYRRAVIVKFDTKTVKVFCIDDGTVVETKLDNIYFMHRKFSNLPRQGMRGRLARLMPPMNNTWSGNAAYKFLELVRNKIVHGSVDSIDDSQSELVYDLVLCDSSQNEDIFIHDVLIAEGYAIRTDDVEHLNDNTSTSSSTSNSESASGVTKTRISHRFLLERMMRMHMSSVVSSNDCSEKSDSPTSISMTRRQLLAQQLSKLK